MPRYYFDTQDNSGVVRDLVGVDLQDDEAARRLSVSILPDMVEDAPRDGKRRKFVVVVRNTDRFPIMMKVMTISCKWLV